MRKYLFSLFFLTTLLPYPTLQAQKANIETPNGYNIFYYPNGRISAEGTMTNGQPDGFWKAYYPTGILKSEGNRLNALLDSTWIFYSELGDTSEIINYRLGKKSGFLYKYDTFTPTNQTAKRYLKSKELFLDDKKEGTAYIYYPNGSIQQTIPYKKNKRQGTAYEYNQEGILQTIYEYHNDYMISREHINRTNKDGIRIGTWKTFHPNGQVATIDYYKSGELSGTSQFYSERGTLINERTYQDGNIVEEGIQLKVEAIEKISYYDNGNIKAIGIFLDSIPIGTHHFYNEEGIPTSAIRYNERGIITAKGPLDTNAKRTGNWSLFFENGAIKASGTYLNDRQNGTWNFFYPDGKQEQIGSFTAGRKEGDWKWFYPNGQVWKQEQYSANVLNGDFLMYSDSNTLILQGQYLQGERSGLWKENIGATTEEGHYEQGLKTGQWKTYYLSGKLAHVGNFLQGAPNGKHLFYYPDGILREEQHYVMGQKNKTWKKYNPNTTLFLTITYQNDRETRVNGQPISKW